VGGCCGNGIPACERVFDERAAAADVRDLHRKGPPWSTRALVDGLAEGLDLAGTSVLDIGAGAGAVHLALLERGAATAVDVDGSSAYLAAARSEAERHGLLDRVTHVSGDAASLAGSLEPADLVALDRVICCYDDVDGLMEAAAQLSSGGSGWCTRATPGGLRAGATLTTHSLPADSATGAYPPREAVEAPLGPGVQPGRAVTGCVAGQIWERAYADAAHRQAGQGAADAPASQGGERALTGRRSRPGRGRRRVARTAAASCRRRGRGPAQRNSNR